MEKPSATTKKPSDQKENNSTASAMARIRFQLNIATGLHALFDLVNMWLGGVLIGKLLAKASAVNIPSIDTNSLMSPLYRVILLDFLSFEVAAGLATAMVVVSLISRCFELSLASNLATMKGRQLRQKVLQQAVGGNTSNSKSTKKTEKHSAPLESDWAKVASALVHHVSIVEDVCQNEEPQVLYAVLKIAFGFVFTFVVLWEAGVMILAFLILQHGASYLVEKKRAPHLKEVEENRASVHARLLDTIKNSVMIYCTGMAKAEGSAMDELEISRDEERTKSNRLRLLREATGIFTAMVPTAVPIVVWYQLSGVNNPIKALELGTAVLVVILLGCESHKSMIQLDGISDRLRAAKEAEAVINSFLGESPANQTVVDELDKTESMRFTDSDEELAPPSILEESTDGLGTRFVLEGAEQIALRQITLQYASRTDPILNNTTISFEKGKIHGLVGESGSGKSTTMKLVAGLISPNEGYITHWQNMQIAYVSQEQNLFARTIRENVSYGAASTPTDDEIWEALAMAQIDGFVRGLPKNLDQELTEGESMVSGGQLQRLHLAHLFCVWKSADVVLLDECLSALDEITREIMIDRLQTFLQGKTAIVITHHSEMLRMCDKVHDMTPSQPRAGLLHKCQVPSQKSLLSQPRAGLLQKCQVPSQMSLYSIE